MVVGTVVTVLSILVSQTNVYAQYYTEITLSNGEHIRMDGPNSGAGAVIIKNGKVASIRKENPDETVRLIVILKDRPLAAYKIKKTSLEKAAMSSVYASLQASHDNFRTALNNTSQQLSAQKKSYYSYTIKRNYYRSLNGVAMECKRGMIGRIRALPMVSSVSMDKEVKANLTESVHQIRADIVQDSLGYTGNGVLVGDIDTGIDYNNPALGGGFGPGFRVIGGYDFVNGDSDPMDDHGHGTHVAGIIGANSGDTLHGVAPGVKFLAIKVLDDEGSGWMSDVIAGIDYCLDPDDNPGTDDAVDIINMSLGGEALEDNPVDSAVNNATKSGVLSIVAAGNSGVVGYGTIGSPGTSESALTVGACDSTNSIAFFSSMGPDPVHSSIKPEVVAPGVHILSTVLDDQTASWSGTSMAAPHVTGMAALLKQEHPLWTPEKIKAAIVNTAHSLGNTVSVYAQGKGRIDALDAAEAQMVVEPGVMSFGFVDLAQAVFMDTLQLKVENIRSVTQNVQIDIIDGVPAGVTLSFDKTSFSLAPGEKTAVQAILAVPSSVPVLKTEPFSYFGSIEVTSDSDKVVVPFSFIKSAVIVVNFDIQPVSIALANQTTKKIINFIPTVPNGTMKYTFKVTEGDSLEIFTFMEQDTLDVRRLSIVNHRIDNPLGLTYVFVSHNEATINLIDTIYDIHNNIVPVDTLSTINMEFYMSLGLTDIIGDQSQLMCVLSYSMLNWQVFVSPLDSSFLIRKELYAYRDSDAFILKKTFHGLYNGQDANISSGPENLIGHHINGSYTDLYLANPAHAKKTVILGSNTLTLTIHPDSGWHAGSSEYGHYCEPNIRNVYYNKEGINQEFQNDKYNYTSRFVGIGYRGVFPRAGMLRTPDLNLDIDGNAVFFQKRIIISPLTASGIYSGYVYETVKSGDTIHIEQNVHVNMPDGMSYIRNGSLFMRCSNDWNGPTDYGGKKQLNGVFESRPINNSYWMLPLSATQAFTRNRLQTNMKPFTPDQWMQQTSSYDRNNAYFQFDNMNNNAGTLRLLCDALPYTILGQGGQCTADFEYKIPVTLVDEMVHWSTNLLGASEIFPSFSLLQVSVDDRAVDLVRPDQRGKIRLMLFDPDSSVTTARISLVLASGDEIVLPTEYSNGEYNASIPAYLPQGFIDIVARAKDTEGNKCELIASPGFYFGSALDSMRLDGRIRMSSYALNNVDSINFNAGDTLKYTLTYTNYGSDTAWNVVITFPATPYFSPVGASTWTIDSLGVNDTVQIPINLVFLGNQGSADGYVYYSPAVTWNSGGTTYLRKHRVLVDFQSTITGVAQMNSTVPDKFELYQNYPNPFNPSTTIKYDISKQSRVKIEIYDIMGRKVATLVDESQKAGSYKTVWNAAHIASGIYFYRLQADSFSETKKLALLK